MRLKEGWRILWRSADSVQVGADAPGAVVIEGLSAAERAVLCALEAGTDVDLPEELPRSCAQGQEVGRRIEDLLVRIGAAQPSDPVGEQEQGLPAAQGPDLGWTDTTAHLDLLTHPHHPDRRLAARLGLDPRVVDLRAGRHVRIDGVGTVGELVARALAEAGVGSVTLHDPTLVTAPHQHRSPDSLPDALPEAEHGEVPRDEVVAARLRRRHRALRVITSADRPGHATLPDLAVVVSSWVAPMTTLAALTAADVPHLPVVVGDVETEVGPLVVPGRTACMRCVGIVRARADVHWPAMATQLATFEDLPVDAATALSAAGAAVQAALAFLDGRAGGLTDPRAARHGEDGWDPSTRSLRLGPVDLLPAQHTWTPQVTCGCLELEGAAQLSSCSATNASTA